MESIITLEASFVTKKDLVETENKRFILNSAPDSSGYYRVYWIVDGKLVFTVQNIHIEL